MKREYTAPKARKIDFVYDEQVTAMSVPSYNKGEYTRYEEFKKCCLFVVACTEQFNSFYICTNDREDVAPFSLR